MWALLPGVHRPEAGLPARLGHRRAWPALGVPADAVRLDRQPSSCDFSDLAAARHCSPPPRSWSSPSCRCCPSCATGRRCRAAWPTRRSGPTSRLPDFGQQPAGRRATPRPGRATAAATAAQPRRRRLRGAAGRPAPAVSGGTPAPAGPPPAPGAGRTASGERSGDPGSGERPVVTCDRRRPVSGAVRRVRRPSGRAPLREWGRGLPARAPAPAAAAADRGRSRWSGWRSPPSWPSTSPAWPDWGWPSSSSRPSTRPVGCPSAAPIALAGQLWLLAQGGRARARRPGPLVLAPLLLTLGIALGAVAAPAAASCARTTLTGARGRRAAVGVLAGAHVLVALLLAVVARRPGGGVGLLRTAAGVAVLAAGLPRAGAWPGVRPAGRRAGPAAGRPPPAAARRARRPAHRDGAVHAPWSRSRSSPTPGVRDAVRLAGRRGRRCPRPAGPRPAAPAQRGRRGARPRRRARASSSAPARWCRCTGSRWAPSRRCRCSPRCPTPRPCR